ncbi:uncharacterized protein N7503_008030 [Penicillium pulvis]|uniref:uncharacterized protein n=1 Tax=Penicillium pulvis TaxID=1562058 RepID=UPI00254945FB|nr:uncharacterized protein N7503_008030 [Penicillium pulvis]KAJ5792052.1 hypothetical protein N7503_008030 [Penicillium pulvis]
MIRLVLNKRSISRDFGLAQRKLARDAAYSPAETESSVDYVASDETGQFHYFGYTSNLQVVARFPPPPSPCSELPVPRDSSLETLADSESIKSQLLDLYFTYQNPATLIIEHETFMKHYQQGRRSSYYSTFLLNCILLRGIRLSDDPRVKSLDNIYLQRAKVELLGELENPNIATIQALCLFGHYQGSWGNDRACWLYPGIAYRLLFDLGLHQDCQDLIRAGFLTSSERKARHATLWGCYVSDKLYCIYQGRPSAVKLQDIAIPRPSLETVGPQWETLDAWVDLASVLDEIITTFNKFPHKKADSNWLTATSNRLFEWLEHLPTHLQWNAQAIPGICALHMQFLSVIIVLHRPFAVYKPRDDQSRSTDHSPSTLARRLCTENAIRISKLLLAFKNNYGTKKIFSTVCHMVLTAALSLISEISTEKGDNKRDEERKWLRVCFSILEELSSTFTVIGRNLKILTEIVESCGYEELAINQAKGADGKETLQEKELFGENEIATEFQTDSDIHRANDLLSSFGGSLPFSLDLADGMMYLDPVPDGFAMDFSPPVGVGGYNGMDLFGFPSAENL